MNYLSVMLGFVLAFVWTFLHLRKGRRLQRTPQEPKT